MLGYETPDDARAAVEAAAVWRVAWWIGLLWSIGTILATAPTLWTLVSGGWAESRLAELRFGSVAAALSVLQCAGAVVLIGALLANSRRRAVAILATVMSLLLLLAVVNGILLGGVWYERSFHLVWVSTIGVRILIWGGIVVVAIVAWRPGAMTPTRLFVAVAILLFGLPAGQIIDPLYWWLARGKPVGQVLRDQFSWQGWPSMLQAGLLLHVSMLLIVMSGAMRKRRWLLGLAVLVAMLGLTVDDFVYSLMQTRAMSLGVNSPGGWRGG